MTDKKITIALVAHDRKKQLMLEWAKEKIEVLKKMNLIGTSHTAQLLKSVLDLDVASFGHGPSGGDIYLAAKILDSQVDRVVFFIDTETPQGHEHDIQTLIRTAVINNIPIALNRATANHIISEHI
ncbi:MAG TPA: methylglyoxal synthase [Marinilabiliales bacterium]|jgi:methylglyoxal synthase|nr:methylglyoxal synthase [Salinivirgaceae bacterium]OFX38501.1 MAG: methylglyoxal synthase [Bacteroidetes bacterium GWA2_40_14]OFX61213.1 MAG: methylglyoxal synthase [Bacteroidetes bacterium GWC2_40_13]OFX75253.1 MAG: methylglyoxal synthase [Bacteroidetes bacterium GWD2_40_43]OFX89850.1 MAG: methylglyoxal synthase [Bacteroidetes bacterium GWE2_40_63]OFY21957.1 MAG: methylglyoxal synthase [Bacteroidetes bacterium GWF2_40_13]OFZ30304.1 MAG: methylglyoxal synthase [Bacteroidetes bacterium RIFOX